MQRTEVGTSGDLPQALDPQGRGASSPLTWLRLQFRASSGSLGLSWKWKGAPWGGRSSSVAPKRRPEPCSGVLHRLPHGGDSSGAWSLTSRISTDRVPVAVLGGEAASRRGLVGPCPCRAPTHPLSLLGGAPALSPWAAAGAPARVREPWNPGRAPRSPSSRARMMALYQPSLRKGDAGLSTRWVWTRPVAPSTCSQSSGS